MNPNELAIYLDLFRMASLSVLVSASLPTIIIGSFAFLIFSQTGWLPEAISSKTLALVPKCSKGYVKSPGVPIQTTCAFFLFIDLRILEFRTGT